MQRDTERRRFALEAAKTVVLIVAVNLEWVFILLNYQQIADIREISAEKPSRSAQTEYLASIGEWRSPESAFLSAKSYPLPGFVPRRIVLPSIGKSAPLFSSSWSGAETLLDSWAVMYDYGNGREGEYVLWHSSSFKAGPYRYLFTKLPKVGKGDVAVIEGDSSSRIYSYVWRRIMGPESLPSLEDGKWKLYLITCYPFLTSLRRYVAEFRFEKEVPRDVPGNPGS